MDLQKFNINIVEQMLRSVVGIFIKRRRLRWPGWVLLLLVSIILLDVGLYFSPARIHNDFNRVYNYKDIEPPKTAHYAVPVSYLGRTPLNPEAQQPPYVGGQLDYSMREPSVIWDPQTYFLKPQYSGRSVAKFHDGRVLYDWEIKTDDFGRRTSATLARNSKNSKCLLVFGDSMVFGEGVESEQTLTSHMSRVAPKYAAYNYGLPAGGPQQALARLQDIQPFEVPQKTGVGLYLFLLDHVRRASPSVFYNSIWRYAPFYAESPRLGKLVRYPDMPSALPAQDFIFNLLEKSQILARLNFNYPVEVGEKQYRRAAKIFKEMERVFKDRFQSDRFYVVLFPASGQGQIVPFLEAAEVKYLNYQEAKLWQLTKDSPYIHDTYDQAPGGGTFKWLAEQLTADLQLKK